MSPKTRLAAVVRGEPGGDDVQAGFNSTTDNPQGARGQPAKVASPDLVVAILEKDARTQVRITINTWRGKTKVHVRQFDVGAIAGTWWPSGKGAALDIARLPELVEAIQKAESEARRLGFLLEGRRA